MVIVWGEVLWDRFPDGDRWAARRRSVAWHLAGLGDRALVTATGDDADGARARAQLAARGVDLALAQVDPARATGEVTVALVDGEPRYRLVPERAWERIAMTAAIAAALPGARAIVYGTLAQRTPAGRAAPLAAAPRGAAGVIPTAANARWRPRSAPTSSLNHRGSIRWRRGWATPSVAWLRPGRQWR
jgi:fructokinase